MSEPRRILERGYELIWREDRLYFDVEAARREALD